MLLRFGNCASAKYLGASFEVAFKSSRKPTISPDNIRLATVSGIPCSCIKVQMAASRLTTEPS